VSLASQFRKLESSSNHLQVSSWATIQEKLDSDEEVQIGPLKKSLAMGITIPICSWSNTERVKSLRSLGSPPTYLLKQIGESPSAQM
jgi:hypothetical protein